MNQTIYIAAPNSVRQTDRYEKYYFLLAHHFAGCELLEARELFPDASAWFQGWIDVLARINTLVFIRDEHKGVGKGTFAEIMRVHTATNAEEELVLTPWDELRFSLKHSKQRTYAIVKRVCDRQPDAHLQEVTA